MAHPDPIGPRVLFVYLGGGAAELTGDSRAAQWMLLDQLIDEVRGRIAPDSNLALLTPAGRSSAGPATSTAAAAWWSASTAPPTSASCCAGRSATACASRSPAASEAWKVAPRTRGGEGAGVRRSAGRPAGRLRPASARRMENAARLHAAGVACRLRAVRRRLAQRAQDPPARRQRGRQRPALGRRRSRPDARAGRNLRRRRPASAASRSASAPTWCCGAAIRWRSARVARAGVAGRPRRSRCARARPNCAIATCVPPTACRAPTPTPALSHRRNR